MAKAMRNFHNGTAPDPSGIRANHFKEVVFCPAIDLAYAALQALNYNLPLQNYRVDSYSPSEARCIGFE